MIKDYCTHISKSDAPWVVLINGLFSHYDLWQEAVTKLKDEFNVLCYNCRGQEKEATPLESYELRDHVNDLLGLVDRLSLDQVILVGISNGGRIALKFASLYSERCLRVVASDTFAESTAHLKTIVGSWYDAQMSGGHELRFNVASPWVFGASFIAQNAAALKDLARRGGIKNNDIALSLIKASTEDKIEIENIACPVLFLVGKEDILTPYQLHDSMVKRTSRGELIEVKGGHASLYEYADNFDHYVIPYLKRSQESFL